FNFPNLVHLATSPLHPTTRPVWHPGKAHVTRAITYGVQIPLQCSPCLLPLLPRLFLTPSASTAPKRSERWFNTPSALALLSATTASPTDRPATRLRQTQWLFRNLSPLTAQSSNTTNVTSPSVLRQRLLWAIFKPPSRRKTSS